MTSQSIRSLCTALTASGLLLSLGVVSCREQAASPAAATPKTAAPGPELQAVLSAAPSGEAAAIHVARTTARPGDVITVKGRIMGNASPFVEGRAAFILGDPAVLTACSDRPGDACETPWDTCCDTKEDRHRATATIQVIGADGRVLKEPAEGAGGLAKLATVTVTGTVAKESSPDLLMVNATAIRVGD